MIDFDKLPDLILLCIFKNLPIWQLRVLALLCSRLNALVKKDFGTRLHLRLFCGSVVGKYDFHDVPDNWKLGVGGGEFDMVIRDVDERPTRENAHLQLTLSSDWVVHSGGQIALMVSSFPKVTALTLVTANNHLPQWCAQLIRGWTLKKLEICPYTLRNIHDHGAQINEFWDSVGRSLLEQTQLEHLVFLPNVDMTFNRLYVNPLLRRGTLKTLIVTDYTDIARGVVENGLDNEVRVRVRWPHPWHTDRTTWDGQEFSHGIGQLESIGFNDYHLQNPTTNRALLGKLERVQIDNHFTAFVCEVHPNTWTALRVLALNACECNFSRIFRKLSALTTLEDLTLEVGNGEKIEKLKKLPRLRKCRRWSKLPTVHRFQLSANMDAHEFVKVTHSFPNVDECSLKVLTTKPRALHVSGVNGGILFFDKPLPVWDHFCSECSGAMIRAIEKYGTTNIQSFCWAHRVTDDGNHELIPKVQTFTCVDGGKTRLNFGYVPIE